MDVLCAFVDNITFEDPTPGQPLTARVRFKLAPYEAPCPDCGRNLPTIDATKTGWKQAIRNKFDGQHVTIEVLP